MMYDVEQLDHLSEFFKEKITESLGLGRFGRVENWKKRMKMSESKSWGLQAQGLVKSNSRTSELC